MKDYIPCLMLLLMNADEFITYVRERLREINDERYRAMDEEINGRDGDYRLLGNGIEEFPVWHPRRRRGS